MSKFKVSVILVIFALIGIESYAKPNFVVILVDDMCYDALSYTGGKELKTPNIDRLCQEGRFCTNGYVTHGVCAPSRAGLMTGRYQARFGYETLSGNTKHAASIEHGVDVNELTIADILKKAGYTSAAMGKWHLGVNDKFQPLQRGFDHHFGFKGRCSHYPTKNSEPLCRNGKPVEWKEDEYLTDRMVEESEDWMRKVAAEGKPFFLYFSTFAVHGKWLAPKELIPEGKHPMVGMMKNLDIATGRLIKCLEEIGQLENTLVVFLNDNGGVGKLVEHGFSNHPFRGHKADVLEGGVRVPYTFYWKGHIKKGTYPGIVSSLDLLPTFAALAGVELPKDREYDGVNLYPMLMNQAEPLVDRTLCWRWRNGHAVRKGKWKLVWKRDFPATKKALKEQGLKAGPMTNRPNYADRNNPNYYLKPELYNLDEDPGETKNLADRYPKVLASLIKELDAYEAKSKPLSPEELATWPK